MHRSLGGRGVIAASNWRISSDPYRQIEVSRKGFITKLEESRFSHMTFMNTLQYYIAPTTVCNLLDARCTIDMILITGLSVASVMCTD